MRGLAIPCALALAWLGGCTNWPPVGGGGMAEQRPLPPRSVTEDPTLRRQLECGLARMDRVAEAAAASQVLAGRVTLARQTAARAQREYQGGLGRDAAQTLERLDTEVGAIRLLLPPDAGAFNAIAECA